MELIGNDTTKKQLITAIESAKDRNRSIPHILFSGQAGCGKTSMAKMIAQISDCKFISVVAESLTDYKSICRIFELLDSDCYDSRGNTIGIIKPSIIFIDEIHGLPLKGQEYLGIAMENFIIEHTAPGKYIWIPYFTLVGATTMEGHLSKPFIDRFGLKFIFKPYTDEESFSIIITHAKRLGIVITEDAAKCIVKRGRGIPRILVRYVERVRDMVISKGSKIVTEAIAEQTFKELQIDKEGLTESELCLLRYLYEVKEPVGLDNLSIVIGEDKKSIINVIEPFLINKRFLLRTSKGRILTDKGREYVERGNNSSTLIKETIPIDYIRS